MMNYEEILSTFLKKQQIPFKNLALYVEAFTHSSYANENRKHKIIHNERLEFLGDAALQLCATTLTFNIKPSLPEGLMTTTRASLVREESLAMYADKLEMANCLRLGVGEEKNGGRARDALKADAFEAFVGAIYLDVGFDAVTDFLMPLLTEAHKQAKIGDSRDHKSRLQELVQADSKRAIVYELVSEAGPPHNRTFECCVKLDHMVLGYGTGTTKKEAEQIAAKAALSKLAK